MDVDLASENPGGGEPLETEWRLTVPGVLGTHNADRVDGQTLIWIVSPGEKANLHAESSVGPGLRTLGDAGWWVVLALCVLAVVGGAIGFFVLRRTAPSASAG